MRNPHYQYCKIQRAAATRPSVTANELKAKRNPNASAPFSGRAIQLIAMATLFLEFMLSSCANVEEGNSSGQNAEISSSSLQFDGHYPPIIDNFDDGDDVSYMGLKWHITSDATSDNGSTKSENQKDKNGKTIPIVNDNGNYIAQITNYALNSGVYIYAPFIVLEHGVFGEDKMDLSNCVGIKYSYKGVAHALRVQAYAVNDFNFHRKLAPSSNEWKTTTVLFSELAQDEEWGEAKPFSSNDLSNLAWEINGKFSPPTGSLSIDNVECAVASNSVSSSSNNDIVSKSSSSVPVAQSSSSASKTFPFPSSNVVVKPESAEIGACVNGIFTDPRDGKKYAYEQAGSQVWMKENLNYSRQNSLGWCYGVDLYGSDPNRDSESCGSGNGRHYTWNVAMDGNAPQGLCPAGWHIPSVKEWGELSKSGSASFSIKQSGYYNLNPGFPPINEWVERGQNAFYWTSGDSTNWVGVWGLGNLEVRADEVGYAVKSVRCVKDENFTCPLANSSSSQISSSSSAAQSSSSVAVSSSSVHISGDCQYTTDICNGIALENVITAAQTSFSQNYDKRCFFTTKFTNFWTTSDLVIINGITSIGRCTEDSGWENVSCEERFSDIPKIDGGYYVYVPEYAYIIEFKTENSYSGLNPNCN